MAPARRSTSGQDEPAAKYRQGTRNQAERAAVRFARLPQKGNLRNCDLLATNTLMNAATAINNDELLHWLALKLVPGLGTRRAGQLIERYGTPQAIFRSSPSELEASGMSGSVARSIASGCAFEEAADQHQRMLDYGA